MLACILINLRFASLDTDIPTIVIDVGSGSIKAGFAGEDAPRAIFSAVVGVIRSLVQAMSMRGLFFSWESKFPLLQPSPPTRRPETMDLEKHAHVKKDVYVGDETWAFADVLKISVSDPPASCPRSSTVRHMTQPYFFLYLPCSTASSR